MFKTTILACALWALVGCRDRSTPAEKEPSFSRPVESEGRTFETPGTTEEHTPMPAPSSIEEPSATLPDVDDDADTSSIPATGGTNGISADPSAGAGDTSGAGARAVTPQRRTVPPRPMPRPPAQPNAMPGQPQSDQPPVELDPATPAGEGQGQNETQPSGTTETPSSGTSETSSGNGTPTNTGINSEK